MMEKYGVLTIIELKQLLRSRGASLKGKKKDLIERLMSYDKNDNFRVRPNLSTEDYDNETKSLSMPEASRFKDVNADADLPYVTLTNIKNYLSRFEAKIEKGKQLYENQYLLNIRMAVEDDIHFLLGHCKASMKKNIIYNINVHASADGTIEACQCDCSAGEPPNAHCKHVVALLLAIEQIKREKKIILNGSCTQKLQSFHQPSKKYYGSPLKAETLPLKRNDSYVPLNFNPLDPTKLNQTSYRERFRNLCVNYLAHSHSTMPIKQTIKPANMYAVVADHTYAFNYEKRLLIDLKLLNLEDSDIHEIELLTRNQDTSQYWHDLRRTHLTASNFHVCCKSVSITAKRNVVARVMNPTPIKSKEIQHGKDNEAKAIAAYESHGVRVKKCGLILMKEKPYLGASPDGLIGEDTILEVKCPFNQRNSIISEETIPYLWKDSSGSLILEPFHPYYFQIQGQMMVTGRKYANLLIYTFKDWKIINVPLDKKFIMEMEQKLEFFYNEYFQVAIFEKYLYKNYGKHFP